MLKRTSHLLTFYFGLAWRSLTDTGVYLRAALLPGKLVLTYTLMASLLLATGHAVRYRYISAPVLEQTIHDTWNELEANWPDDLALQYDAGRWAITPEQTLTVPYPLGSQPEGLPITLATLSPQDPQELTELPNSLVIAGPTTVFIRSANENAPQGLAWSELLAGSPAITIDKATIQEFSPTVLEQTSILTRKLAYLVLLWWFLGVWLLRLLGLVVYAWLAQALWTLRGRQLRYATVYKMGLLIIPVAELILLTWYVLWPEITPILSFWWIWLLIMSVIVVTAPKKN